MKLKSVFAWLFVVALAGSAIFLYLSNSQKIAELAGLRAVLQKAQEQRAELEQAKTDEAASQSSEIERLRKDNVELLRLRNEVRQLREDGQQLAKQAQTAQVQAQAAQTLLVGAQQREQQLQQLQTENQQLRALTQQTQQRNLANPSRQTEYEARIKAIVDANGGPATTQGQAVAACINNLRQIDGAMQQWALENGKTANAIPSLQDITPYLMNRVLPACPAGGRYTLNSLSAGPTCSIPGHVLPR